MECEITFYAKDEGGFFARYARVENEEYYFKVKSEYKAEITESADPFAILLIFRMMRQGGDFRIRGQVSESLLDNLELFASYWNVLFPDSYKKIKINAEYEINDKPQKLENKAVACFSGGLDASFLLYRHKKGLAGRNNKNIERALLIHGADIKLSDKKCFDGVFSKCERMCADLNVPLVSARMNYRRYPHNWEMEHIAFMAAALRFWKNYPYQMIGSTYPVNAFKYPWGSNPVTDHLFSSNSHKVIPDGMDSGRTAKAAIVKDWEEGMKNLRVCWEGADKTGNCGVCEKCMRTYLNFRAAGVYEIESMENKFNLKNLKNLNFDKDYEYYQEIFEYAGSHNISDPVFLWLKKRAKNNKTRKAPGKFTSLRYKILSKIMSGKRKKHYEEKLLSAEGKSKNLSFYVFE